MPYHKKLALVASTVAATAIAIFSTSAVAADDDSKFEMVGIRLGMTPEQVVPVLKAHGIGGDRIYESRMAYSYSDGINHGLKTDDFLARITASKVEVLGNKRRDDSFELFFSPPPAGGKLVGVQRVIFNNVDPITGGQFRQALVDKYGSTSDATTGILNWKFGGGDMNCLSTNPKGVNVSLPSTDLRQKRGILDMVYRKAGGGKYRLDLFLHSRVKDLAQCASMLEYRLGTSKDNQPASRVEATMIDVQSWVKAELAANERVDKLRSEAVEKRVGKGNKPSL
ncbi:MAG: hypothetical protein R3E92_12775 [Burkholderiaceae bacterium]|nr:hypothetical protein [Rhodoferax sp.]MCB2027270.1 hypothetical protein [Rhodoferax sp.]MCP5262080.1 hypothetical protein [Rhodoferax sp.]